MIITPPLYMNFPTKTDERGSLTVLDGWQQIPFAVKRLFWIYGVPEGAKRGGHAHELCQQVIIAMTGAVRITVNGQEFWVNGPHRGLYIPPGLGVTLDKFSPGAVLLILCSHLFDEEDYIKDVMV